MRLKLFMEEYKKGKSCPCGESEPCCLEFHHRERKQKRYAVGDMTGMSVSLATLKKEIEKCALICSNCHKKLHAREHATQLTQGVGVAQPGRASKHRQLNFLSVTN